MLVASLGFFSPTLPWHLLIPQLQVAWLQPGTNCCCLQSNWHSPGVRLILQTGSLTHGSDSARALFRDLHVWMLGNHETSPWLPFLCSFQHLPKLPSFHVLVTEAPFSPAAHILYLRSRQHGAWDRALKLPLLAVSVVVTHEHDCCASWVESRLPHLLAVWLWAGYWYLNSVYLSFFFFFFKLEIMRITTSESWSVADQ